MSKAKCILGIGLFCMLAVASTLGGENTSTTVSSNVKQKSSMEAQQIRSKLKDPEIWMCVNSKSTFDLLSRSKDWSFVRKRLTGIKLYIGVINQAPAEKLSQLVSVVKENDFKVTVECGGTLNHDWQDQAGEKSAETELAKLEKWYQAGGKIDYLDLDGPVRRLLGHSGWGKDEQKKFTSAERCADELVDYIRAVKKRYSEIRFFLLTNFPNWGYKGDVSYTRAGLGWGDYDKVARVVLDKLDSAGLQLEGVTVDNPYEYAIGEIRPRHLKDPSKIDWIKRIRTYEEFSRSRNLEFNLIVNSSKGGKTSDKEFYERTLKMVDAYTRANGRPTRYIVQSWYEYPKETLPETAPYSMTSLVKAIMLKLHPHLCRSDSMPADWLREAETYTLPAWFEGTRVQAHSEHGIELALRMTAEAHAKVIRSLGADVLTRIFLNREEGAWWPSKVGETHPLIGGHDFAAEIVRAVHGQDMKVIGYFRHMCDAAMQKQHPDWICRGPDGSPTLEVRGKPTDVFVLCMNSPYRQFIQTRLLELAERGLDGIYFDSWHMPDICTCKYCKKAFREEAGHEMDVSAPIGSPAYLEAVDFVNRTMVRTFQQWREAVHAAYPDVVFSIKSSRYPMFEWAHIDERLLAISETSGTEFHKPFGWNSMRKQQIKRNKKGQKIALDFAAPAYDDQLALGWSIVRDGSFGRPPLMWIPHIRSEQTALYSAAAAVTYGCVAAMSIPIREPQIDGLKSRKLFGSCFEMGRKTSPYLAYARPIGWAALHISEQTRNARLGDDDKMWQEFFAPVFGALQALKEEHLPWTTINDRALTQGPSPETQLLVLPWPDELDDSQRAAVAHFEHSGGAVLRLNPRAGWDSKKNKAKLVAGLKEQVHRHTKTLAIRISGPEAMHAVCFDNPKARRLTICLANTWGWFRSTREPNPKLNEGTPPPPCRGVSITISAKRGAPKKVFDALGQKNLTFKKTQNGFRVEVPNFQINACVVFEF